MISFINITDADNYKVTNYVPDVCTIEFTGAIDDHSLVIAMPIEDDKQHIIFMKSHFSENEYIRFNQLIGRAIDLTVAKYDGETLLVNNDMVGISPDTTIAETVKHIISMVDRVRSGKNESDETEGDADDRTED